MYSHTMPLPYREWEKVRNFLHLVTILSLLLSIISPVMELRTLPLVAWPELTETGRIPATMAAASWEAAADRAPFRAESGPALPQAAQPQRSAPLETGAVAGTVAGTVAGAEAAALLGDAGLGESLLPGWMTGGETTAAAPLAQGTRMGSQVLPAWLPAVVAKGQGEEVQAAPVTAVGGEAELGSETLPGWLAYADLQSGGQGSQDEGRLRSAPGSFLLPPSVSESCLPTVTLTISTPQMVTQGATAGELFTVTVENTGTVPIPNVTLPITPSAGFYFIGSSANAESSTGGALTLIQPIFNTTPGAPLILELTGDSAAKNLAGNEIITFTFRLAADFTGASEQPLAVGLPNSEVPTCQASIPVYTSLCTPLPGLALDLTLPPGLVSRGNTAGDVYTFTVTNNGTLPTSDVSILVDPSPGFYFVAGSAAGVSSSHSGITVTQPAGNTAPGDPFEIAVGGSVPTTTLAPGATMTFTFRLATDGDAESGQPLLITVQSGKSDRQSCTFTQRNVPTGRGNLTLIKSPAVQSAMVGDVVTWTLSVRNSGLGNLYSPLFTDTIGTGLTLLSISPDPDVSGNVPDMLAPEEFANYTVTGRVDSCGALTNTAQGTWSIGNVDGRGLSGNPVTTRADLIYDYQDPNITVEIQPIEVDYCGTLDTTALVTVTNSGGSVQNFRLGVATNNGIAVDTDTDNWDVGSGVFTYTGAANGVLIKGAQEVFTMTVTAPTACAPSVGNIILTPLSNDACDINLPINSPPAQRTITSPGAPTLNLTKAPEFLEAQAGDTVVFTLTASGSNPNGVMDSINITDSLPAILTDTVYQVTSSPAVTPVVGNNLDITLFPTFPTYNQQVIITSTIPAGESCGGGIFINRARASYPGCPDCNLADADASLLYVSVPPGGPGSGNSFRMSSAPVELCGDAPEIKQAFIEIDSTTGITWTGTVYEDDLGTGLVGPLAASNVQVEIDGIDRTSDVTVTTSSSAPRLRVEFDNVGIFSNTALITITYEITAAADATTGRDFYFSRFTMGDFPSGECGGSATALNRIELQRATLSDLAVAPGSLRSCAVNDVVITVDGSNLDTTVASGIVVTFTAQAGDIFTPTAPILGGDFFGEQVTVTVGTNNVVTFTFPITLDLDSAGTIGFPLFRPCGVAGSLGADLGYADACGVPRSDSATGGLQTTASNVQLLVSPIERLINSRESDWQFSVRNTGNQAATNLRITNTLPAGHSFVTYTVSNVSQVISDGVSFVTQTNGGLEEVIFTIAELPANSRIQFDGETFVAACTADDELVITLADPCGQVGGTCAATQTANLTYRPGDGVLLSSNSQTGLLPLCETGEVVLTVKNASAQTDLYTFVITETLDAVTYVPGTARITLIDINGDTVINNQPFSPTQVITYNNMTVPVTQTLIWEFDQITETYPEAVRDALLERDASDTIEIRFDVQTSCDSTVTRVQSEVAARNVCGDLLTLQESAKTLVVGEPDLRVTKDVRNVSGGGGYGEEIFGAVGDVVEWRVQVQNAGLQRAVRLLVTDTLPSQGFVLTGTNIVTSSQVGNLLGWHENENFPLAVNAISTYLITGTLTAEACAINMTNVGAASFACTDETCLTEFVTADAFVDTKPRFSVAPQNVTLNQCGPGPIVINFSNQGAQANNVVVSYTLPSGFIYDGLAPGLDPMPTISPTLGASGVITFGYAVIPTEQTTNTLRFNVASSLSVCPVTATGTADMRYEDSCGTVYDDVIERQNTLTVQSPNLVGNLGGQFQTPLTRVVTDAQVATWQIGVRNSGNGTAYNVVISETLGAGYTNITGTTSTGSGGGAGIVPVAAGNTITWTVPELAADGTFAAVLTGTVLPAPTDLGLTLTVSSRCDNGGCAVTAPILRKYATALQNFTKIRDPAQATIGELVVFTVTGDLFGDYLYSNVILSDTLPTGLGYRSSTLVYVTDRDGSGGGPTTNTSTTPTSAPALNSSGAVRWSLGDLEGQIRFTATITAVVQNIPGNFEGVVRNNTASLTYRDDGQNYSHTTPAVPVTVREPLLHIGKSYVTPQECRAILFEDDFNNGNSTGWSSSGTWSVNSGVYQQTATGSTIRRAYAGTTSWTDYSYSFMMRIIGSSTGSIGGYVRQPTANAADDGYLFRWNTTGMQLQRRNTLLNLTPTFTGPLAETSWEANRWYHVEMRVSGFTIDVFVDGVRQLSAIAPSGPSDSPKSTGRIGLYVNGLGTGGVAEFDDVLVTHYDTAFSEPGLTSPVCGVAANDLITYTLTISNQAQVIGQDLIITDVLPAGMSLHSYSLSSDDPASAFTAEPALNAEGTLVWNVNQLGPRTPFVATNHTQLTLTVTTRVSPTIPAASLLTNQALLSYDSQTGSGPADIQRGYSGGSHSATVQTPRPTAILKAVDPITATIGQMVVYTITVPSTPITAALTTITVTDQIAQNLRITDTRIVENAAVVNGQVSANGQQVTATFERIEANAQAQIVITTVVSNTLINQDGVVITNTARLDYNEGIGTPGGLRQITSNEVSTELIESVLQIAKSATPSTGIGAGDEITYVLTLSHAPQSRADAFDIDFEDQIPGVLTYKPGSLQIVPSPVISVTSEQLITATLATLPLGSAAVITYVVRVDAATQPNSALTNTAQISYTSLPGPNPDERTGGGGVNDYITDTVESVRTGGIEFAKRLHDDRDYTIGEAITYSLIITLPTGLSRNVVITDFIPAGLRFDPVLSPLSVESAPILTLPTSTTTFIPGPAAGDGSTQTQWVWTFNGDIAHTNEAPVVITRTFRLIVANVAQANHGETKVNTATLTYSNAQDETTALNSEAPPVTLVEPLLIIEKLVTPESALRGSTLFYDIRVYHATTSTVPAYNVRITDVVPSDLSYISNSWQQFSGIPADAPPLNDTNLPELIAGWSVIPTSVTQFNPIRLRYNLVIPVDAVPPTPYRNTITTTWTSLADDPYGDTRDGSGGVDDYLAADSAEAAVVEISLRKNGPLTVTAGSLITYTLEVFNSGPFTATDAVVRDIMPFQTETVTATFGVPEGNTGVCDITPDPNGDVILCSLGDVRPGITGLITITARVNANIIPGADLTNRATLQTSSFDPDLRDNETSFETEVEALADLDLRKSGPATVTAGAEVTYTVVLTNNGPSLARTVDVKDLLPPGITYVGGSSSQGACVSAICQLGDVAVGSVITLVITGAVGSGVTGIVTNTAQIFAATGDPNPGNDRDTAQSTVESLTALQIAKRDLSDPVFAGSSYFYEIVITNTGPSDAVNVVVTDTLPAQVTVVGSSPECSFDTSVTPNTVTCNVGSFPAGERRDFLINVEVESGVISGTVGVNTTGITTTTPVDLDNSILTDTEETVYRQTVGLATDLQLSKSGTPAGVIAGQGQVTFTLHVTNAGTSPASGVQVVDAFPGLFTFVSAVTSKDSSLGLCSNGVTCDLGELAVDESVVITAVFDVPAGVPAGIYTNTAHVSSPAGEVTWANNTDTASVVVAQQADLQIRKVAHPDPATPGEDLTYTLLVTNTGPSDAANVVVTDSLPAGFITDLILSSQGGCASLPCTLGSLPAGSSAWVVINGRVAEDAVTSLTNRAGVTSDTPGAGASVEIVTPLSSQADLALTKVGTATARPGESVVYTVTVRNLGPSAAATVRITDTLPAGLTFASASGCTNTGSGNQVVCEVATLDANAEIQLIITATVDADVLPATSLENRAEVTSATADPNPLNNGATADTSILGAADMVISKQQITPNPVTAGELVSYTIRITNTGPGLARSVDVKDQLPAGMSLISAAASNGGVCGGPVCQFGTLQNGASRTVTITARVDADTPAGTLTNSAAVFSTDETDPSNDTATVETSIVTEADISVTKVDLMDPVSAGSGLLYQIVVANAGPSDAQDVIITDTLPADVSFVSAAPGCLPAGGDVICTVGTLPAGTSASFLIAVNAAQSLLPGDVLTNIVTATTSTPDPTPINTDTVTTTVAGFGTVADLGLTKSGPATVIAGEQITYTLTVTNGGPAAATNVQLLDLLPAGTSALRVSVDNPDFGDAFCSLAGVCALGTVYVTTTATITLVLAVDGDFPGDTLVNTASVTGDQQDPNPGDNLSSVSTGVTTEANLAVAKRALPDVAFAGEVILYQVTVTNTGPSTARNVLITDTLPAAETTFTGATVLCSESAGDVVCALGDLAAGQTASVFIQVRADADLADGTTLNNTVAAGSDTPDPDDTDNDFSAPVTVNQPAGGPADLVIRKDATASVIAGETVTYTLTITNLGPAMAQDVQVIDALPRGVTLVEALPSQGICASGVVCTLGDLEVGEEATVVITVSVDPAVTGLLTNRAAVQSSNPDPDPDNNSASAETLIQASAALTLTKIAQPPTARPGDLVVYQIVVTNTGPSAAASVVISDPLPASLRTPLISSSAGGCTAFPCGLGTLNPGESATVLVIGWLADDAAGAITNTATVTTSTPLSNPGDDQEDSATIQVASLADLTLTKQHTPNPVQAGTLLTYTLTVLNRGPAPAANLLVTDSLPFGVAFQSGANCAETSPGSGVVICSGTVNPLPPGSSETFTFTVMVSDSVPAGIALVNSAVVGSDTPDPNPDNNRADTVTSVLATANLSISKSSAPESINAGELLTYTILVTNSGPARATDVRVLDTIPTQLTLLGIETNNGGVCNAGILCLLGSMDVGETVTITIRTRVDSNLRAGTQIVNQATAFSEQLEPPLPINATDITEITEEVDLRVQKQDFPDPVAVDGFLRYQILVSNDGPSDAFNVTITDTLDSNVIFQTASFGGAHDGASAGGIVTWTLPSLRVGEERTLEVNVRVFDSLADGWILTNRVEVASDSFEANQNNNTAEITTLVRAGADLFVRKTGPEQTLAGELITYQIEVGNNGPAGADAVRITDTLPSAILTSTVSFTSSLGLCSQAERVITCELGTLASGDRGIITITGQVNPAATLSSVLNNTVTASTETLDSNQLNNSASHQTLVVGVADLAIGKSASTASAIAGLTIVTYTLTITNQGPSQAQNVFVDDPLTPGLIPLSAVTSQGVCASGVACSIGTLSVGQSALITVTALVAEDVEDGSILRNVARVTGAVVDPDPSNNEADHLLAVSSAATLQIEKIDRFDPVAPGEPIFYRVTVTNTGPSAARDLTITDTLPAGVIFQSAGVDCQHDGSPSGGQVICTLPSLGVNQRYVFDLVAFAPMDVVSGTLLTNQVDASASNAEPVSATEETGVRQQFAPPADLSVDKRGPASVVAGEAITYTIVVTNHGPATAIRPDLKDLVPDGVSLTSASASQGFCVPSTLGGICQFGNMAPGQAVTVTLVGQVDPSVAEGSILTNTAQIFSSNPDPNPADNQSSASTTVSGLADLQVTKQVSTDPVVPGQGIAYQIRVYNAGPSAAVDVVITETIPAEVGSVRLIPGQGSCTGLTCTLGSIPAGAAVEVTVLGILDPGATGTFTNGVTVESATPDPDESNNIASAEATPAPAADLALVMSSTPTINGGEGGVITYTVSNSGPSVAQNVVITATFPEGVTPPPGWLQVGSSDLYTYAVGSVAPGETVVVTGTVEIDPALLPGTSLEFSGSVGSSTPDPDPANNRDDADTSLVAVADLSLRKDGPASVTAGETITYTLVFTNHGPSTARLVDVKDQLPPGVSLLRAAIERTGSAPALCGGLVCQVGDMPAGEVVTVTVVGQVSGDVAEGSILTNTATLFSSSVDPDLSNNSDSAATGVESRADLAVSKVALSDPVGPTEQFLYEIVVRNLGPSTARQVVVTDTLDLNTTFLSASDGCLLTPPGSPTVVCTVGDLADGASRRYLIAVRAGDLISGTRLINQVVAASATQDPVTANNAASITTTVVQNFGPIADLELTKAGNPATVVAGQLLTYTLIVTNHGPAQASQVQILDALPEEVTLIRATPSSGICAGATCLLGNMPPNSSRQVTLLVRVKEGVADGATLLNVAVASSPTADGDAFSSYDTETTPVQAQADLTVTKSHGENPVAGQPLNVTLTVGNRGPSTAVNVALTDTLPAGMRYVSDNQGCTLLSGPPDQIRCELGDLPPGSSRSVLLTVALDPALQSPITNTVAVASDTVDPVPQNNSAQDAVQPASLADLRLLKTDSPDPVIAGEQITYTLMVHNLGPSLAQGVIVTDTLPPGLDYLSDNAGCLLAGVAENGGQILACGLGDLAAGDSRTFQIRAAVDAAVKAGSTLFNNAQAASQTLDPRPENNDAIAATLVLGSADMALTKSGPDGPVVAGETVTYTIVITNNGPSLAEDVDVKEFLPPGMSLTSAQIDSMGTPCAAGICQFGDIDAGQVHTITVVAVVDADAAAGTLLENQAQVFTDSPDPDPDNNRDSWSNPVDSRALLTVQKRDLNDPIGPENLLFYAIEVHNAGPSAAVNVVVTDSLPSQATYVASTAECAETVPGLLVCALGTIPANGRVSFLITVRVDPTLPNGTVLTNQIAAGSDTPLDAGSVLTDSETTTVSQPLGSALDLSVRKLASDAVAGSTMTYTLLITNNGPGRATGVTLLDALPNGIHLLSVESSQGLCERGILCLLGDLENGDTLTVTVVADVPIDTPPGTLFTNTVFVQSNEPDLNPADNADQVTSPILYRADLAVTKQPLAAHVVAGTQVSYTLRITNRGPSIARNVVVTDQLMAGASFIAAQPAPDLAPDPLVWRLGDLAVGQSAQITVTLRVATWVTGVLTNTGLVGSDTPDPAPGDNVDSPAPLPVLPSADLQLHKSAQPAIVAAGERLTYTLVLTNAGPSDAVNVVVRDTLPAALTFLAAQPPASSGPNPLIWELGRVTPGTVITLTVSAMVNPDAPAGPLANTATATSDTVDPNPGDTESAAVVDVTQSANLRLSKQAAPDPVLAGDLLTYTLAVTNDGPSLARAVRVMDGLPPGVTFVSATPAQSSGPNPLRWDLGDLAPGESRTLAVVVRVNRSAPSGIITNNATVSSQTPDPTPEDNSASAPSRVVKPILSLSKQSTDLNGPPLEPRDQVRYTLILTNSGDAPATGVVVTDPIPANTTYVAGSAVTSQGSVSGPDPLVWNLGTVPPNRVITMSFVVAAGVLPNGTQILNQATASAAEVDPITAQDTTQPMTTQPGIAVAKELVSPSPAYLTGEITYRIRITNTGNTVLTAIPLVDDYDARYLFFVRATPPPDQIDPVGGSLSWADLTAIYGDLWPGQAVTVEVVMLARAITPSGERAINRVSVQGAQDELGQRPPAGEDEAEVSVLILPNVAVSKRLNSPNPVTIGSTLTFTIRLTNTGQTNIVTLPLIESFDQRYISYNSSIPAPDRVEPGQLEWDNLLATGAPLPPGQSVTVLAIFTATRVTTQTLNFAIVEGAVDEEDNTTGSGDEEIIIIQEPTAVELLSFRGQAVGRAIRLIWETGLELNTWGFHLWRSTTGNRTDALRITPSLIPSTGSSSQGSVYSFTDQTVEPGIRYTYWLQELEVDGTTHEYGPIQSGIDLDIPGEPETGGGTLYLPLINR